MCLILETKELDEIKKLKVKNLQSLLTVTKIKERKLKLAENIKKENELINKYVKEASPEETIAFEKCKGIFESDGNKGDITAVTFKKFKPNSKTVAYSFTIHRQFRKNIFRYSDTQKRSALMFESVKELNSWLHSAMKFSIF